ncbi:MAG: mannose-1-phosphate guanylyltransferase [Victivallales bacterium]|nr:mannose-1-phosphate guanylyltransferase [Victivallales bacterium]
MTPNDTYAVIMAGGKGERFWPLSRASRPKQLLPILGSLTMIEETISRLGPTVSPQNTLVITNNSYVGHIGDILDTIPRANIIGEPCGRDTAPCVALAAAAVSARNDNPDAVMIILPADHVIRDKEAFQTVLSDCAAAAEKGHLVTIGINPRCPSTAYGYIKCSSPISMGTQTRFLKGESFIEKPDIDTAKELIRDPSFKWNSGMFAWSVSTITEKLNKHAPEIAEKIPAMINAARSGKLENTLQSIYPELPKVSIDYALMEKSDDILVAECSFDWDDIGNWTALRNQISPDKSNNVVKGLHIGVGTSNSIIYGDGSHLIATIDVDDLIVVQTKDATLVCKSASSQKIKDILQMASANSELKRFI